MKPEIKPVYEFLLWDNCNNNCTFCHQRNDPRIFDVDEQKQILYKTLRFIKDESRFISGSHVLLVGGELFHSLKLFHTYQIFFDQLIGLMRKGTIDLLYVNTNLLYKDLDCLQMLLDFIDFYGFEDRLKFTTSYDLKYRFKNEEEHRLFLNNFLTINKTYPDIKTVTNMILTDYACDCISNNWFNFRHFMETYKTYINFIPFIINNPELGANREKIFKTLKYIDDRLYGDYLPKYIANFDLPQEKKLFSYKNGNFEYCSCENNTCGHSINFTKYSDKGSCFVCDLKEIFHG